MKVLLVLSSILCAANFSWAQALDVGKEKAYTVNVKDLTSIQYRLVAEIRNYTCNNLSFDFIGGVRLSAENAKHAFLKINGYVVARQTECLKNVKPEKITLESDWIKLNTANAEKITFLVNENETIEVQK